METVKTVEKEKSSFCSGLCSSQLDRPQLKTLTVFTLSGKVWHLSSAGDTRWTDGPETDGESHCGGSLGIFLV